MNRILLILFILVIPLSTDAALGNSCSTFLNKLVELVGLKAYEPPKMTRQTQDSFKLFQEKGFKEIKNVSYKDVTSVEGKYLLSILPKEMLEYMKQMPKERESIIIFKRLITDRFGFKGDSILQNIYSIINSIQRWKNNGLAFEIDLAIKQFEDLPPAEKIRIEQNFKFQQFSKKASDHWQNFGKYKMIIFEKNNRIEVKIGIDTYVGKRTIRRGRSIISLEVPVDKVKHPAWNPLDHNYIAKLASDPFRVNKLEYDAVLGHDGNFYLMDGNHRFTLYDKPTVQLLISEPVKTESLRIFFDLQNIKQPTRSQTIEIFEGTLDPYELIPNHIKRNLIFRH